MSDALTESDVEEAALAWLEAAGWQVAHGPDRSPGGDTLTLALSQGERGISLTLLLSQGERERLGRGLHPFAVNHPSGG